MCLVFLRTIYSFYKMWVSKENEQKYTNKYVHSILFLETVKSNRFKSWHTNSMSYFHFKYKEVQERQSSKEHLK